MHPPVPLLSIHTLLFLLFTLSFVFLFSSTPVHHHNTNINAPKYLVRTSCVHASYPDICLRTLSSYTGPAPKTPRDLAQAAIRITLSCAHKLHSYLTHQLSVQGTPSKRQRAVLGDCVEQISDSVGELRRTLDELKHLRSKTFRWQMSNAQTWVSAALTNEDTCLDSFQDVVVDGKIKSEVRRKIRSVAKVTSNALYMINRLDNTSVRTGDPA